MSTNKKYDWKQIQKDYDDGLSYVGLMNKYGMASTAIKKAMHRGDLKTRDRAQAVKDYHELRKQNEFACPEPDNEIYYPANEWHEIIHIEDRRPDYIYDIGTGITQSYAFRTHNVLDLHIIHDYKGAQDYSIMVWFSERPIDPPMLATTPYEWFNLKRSMTSLKFYDVYGDRKYDNGFPLPPCKTYWINFKNLQVLPNQFYLKFSH